MLPCQSLSPLHRGSGNRLGNAVPLLVLLGAEVRTKEDLLHAENLHTLRSRIGNELLVLFQGGLLDLVERGLCIVAGGLNQTAPNDPRHT